MVAGRSRAWGRFLAAAALVSGFGLAGSASAQPAEKPAGGDAHKNAWVTLVDFKWVRDGKEAWKLTFQATTVLPEKSTIQVSFRFGDVLVTTGKCAFLKEGAVAGEIAGIQRSNPPGEYGLVFQSGLTDQDPTVAPLWVQRAGLVQSLEDRFPIQFGGPEEETAARKAEYDGWVAWLASAREVMKAADSTLGNAKAPSKAPTEACATVREALGRTAEAEPRLFTLSYFRGTKERAGIWMTSVERFLKACETTFAEKAQLPVDVVSRVRRLQKSLEDIAEFVGANQASGTKDAAGLTRRGGGRYLHPTFHFELRCDAPGWGWVERTTEDRCLALEQPVAPWRDYKIEVFARPLGTKDTLEAFHKSVLGRFAAAHLTQEEPAGGMADPAIKETKGCKFTWSKDQSQYGWLRTCRSADGRLVALVATGPNNRWAGFQPIANDVFPTLTFKSGE